jgi:hypothetical protein
MQAEDRGLEIAKALTPHNQADVSGAYILWTRVLLP